MSQFYQNGTFLGAGNFKRVALTSFERVKIQIAATLERSQQEPQKNTEQAEADIRADKELKKLIY
ncbi:hypothetical protein [Ruegeria sp. HKCCD7255]|uniref:hypothetical protein n=1 Tax=Ruegeria sp. HKCCD7255 TaxID=2683004 RepID=UPI001488FFF2|nr:hypothetical protein [Ruegeria sp. HKCCD7255]